MMIATKLTISLTTFSPMILYLLVLKRRRNDVAYQGIQSNTILTSQNQIYSQNTVVQNGDWISTVLNIIYLIDINIHDTSIRKNTWYLNFTLWVMSSDKTKLDINIIKNHINCCVLNNSPNNITESMIREPPFGKGEPHLTHHLYSVHRDKGQ
jgi:hypothetical protein